MKFLQMKAIKQRKGEKMMKKFLVLILAVAMLVSFSAVSVAEGEYDGGITNATGYPITVEPITLTAWVGTNSYRVDMDKTNVWDYVFEKTNIRLEVIEVTDSEQIGLAFASREYPDIMFAGPSTAQLNDAAKAGDLVCFDDYADLLPTWNAFFEKYPLVKATEALDDGKIYSVPFCNFLESDRLLRDMWLVNKTWLDTAGVDVPTTTQEFYDAMVAIQEHAGEDTIPENVQPVYFFFDNYIGGQFDFYGSFGVYVSTDDYLAVIDDEVVFQALNPDIKEPLKYLQSLYQAGLVMPESFTDDYNTYLTRVASNPLQVATFGSFNNTNLTEAVAIAPLDAENGSKPVMRKQTYVGAPSHAFQIFSKCEYPAAAIRLAEFLVDEAEHNATILRGRQGIFWEYTEDGKIEDILWTNDVETMLENSLSCGLWNSIAGFRDTEWYANYYDANEYVENHRSWAWTNIYKNYICDWAESYVSTTLDANSEAMMKQYGTDIANYRKTTFARWITTDADIDAEWDEYVEKINELNVDEWLSYKQEAYDLLVNKVK